jgi:hypothetical protein
MIESHLTTLLRQVNQQHGTTFTLGERYPGGEQGAFALRDATGSQFVLKWTPEPSALSRLEYAASTTGRLRRVGYPAPKYVASGRAEGGVYSIQSVLPGTPLQSVSGSLVPQVLELNALQAGRALPGEHTWPAPVIDAVLYGGTGFCLLESLQTYSSYTAELLRVLQTTVRRYADAQYATGDVVHFDFNPSNILVTASWLTGVIDWEGTCAGDRVFDLATLLFYNYEAEDVREQLLSEIFERVNPQVVSVYLAHLILRQLDWSIRHHTQATVERWLQIVAVVVQDMQPWFKRT